MSFSSLCKSLDAPSVCQDARDHAPDPDESGKRGPHSPLGAFDISVQDEAAERLGGARIGALERDRGSQFRRDVAVRRVCTQPCQRLCDIRGGRIRTHCQPCAKLGDARPVEMLIATEGEDEKGTAVGKRAKRRPEPSVRHDDIAERHHIVVIDPIDSLDADGVLDPRVGHGGPAREQTIHTRELKRGASVLHEALLALHDCCAEGEEGPAAGRDAAVGAVRTDAERAGVDDVRGKLARRVEPPRERGEKEFR